ncbi:MAG: hypothetical protein M3Q30_00975 [Actinomycetota bacterium]|nr:hypothetical protein [Actinomycetota bacterium]
MSQSNEIMPAPPTTPVVVTGVPRRFGDRRRSGRGTLVDLGELVELVPQISEMLNRGDQLVRIVGSKELLDGIRHNTLHYMRGELGHTTAVLDQNSRIVGHVWLQPAEVSSVLAPAAAVFQIASAITLQYYLQRFDQQLTEISLSVRKAREHAAWAEIARAALETAEIAEAIQRHGPLAPDLRARLDEEERAVDVVVLQELLPVEEAVRSLQVVRDEIDTLLAGQEEQSRVARTANVLRETLPGGLRQHLRRALDELDAAMPHWYLAARAAQVHATLRTLRAVDDRLAGRPASAAGRRSLLERAGAQAALGGRVSALLELPAETFDLFGIDRPVESQIERVYVMAASLAGESVTAAERLGLAAERPVEEMFVTTRKGGVVVLPPREALVS